MSAPDTAVVNPSPGASMIAAERYRQIATEGWTPEHDDEHADGVMGFAAQCYIGAANYADRYGMSAIVLPPPDDWPWGTEWWKPTLDPIQNLVKAGALIAAEIDRLQRARAEGT